MTAAVFALRPGDVFHQRYTVVRCIATGGMGSVYEVSHNTTRRRCALKVMLPSLVADADLRARFQAEATITAQIRSEHIVDVLDAGVDGATGTPFIVMELLVGEELCDRLMRLGPMAPAEAVELLRQAALALDRTHAAGIIHRDLKPENFYIARREDGSARMKILDFGIAKVVAESAYGSRQTGTMGTPLYMPPEQVDGTGNINFQADLYSFAQVSYAMLAGEAYFDEELRSAGGVFGLLSRVMAGAKEPASQRARRRRNVSLPAAFDGWFAKASARRPEDRFERATAQVAALAEALGVALPIPAPRASSPSQPSLDAAAGRASAQRGAPLVLGAGGAALGSGGASLASSAAAVPDGSAVPALTAQPFVPGPFPAMQLPQLTGVPVSSDTVLRRRAGGGRRWVLPLAAGALSVSVSVLVWLALDGGRSREGAAAEPAAPPASGVAAVAAPEVTPAPIVSASASASGSASAVASAAGGVATPSASASATASAAASASVAPGPTTPKNSGKTAPKPAQQKAGKPKSVLDVGP